MTRFQGSTYKVRYTETGETELKEQLLIVQGDFGAVQAEFRAIPRWLGAHVKSIEYMGEATIADHLAESIFQQTLHDRGNQ